MTRQRYDLFLSVCATARGLAFVLFEGGAYPVDWGRVEFRGVSKNHRCIERFIGLLDRYRPDMVILQEPSDLAHRRSYRAAQLTRAFSAHAEGYGIPFVTRSRKHVLDAFSHLNPCTKQAIAQAIVEIIPAFGQHLPRHRAPWMSEDYRMGLFDSAALALSLFHGSKPPP
jgi:hypothetical protein